MHPHLPVTALLAPSQARVEAAGGRVFWQNGFRVMGALSMSRAIGDHYLQRFGVIPNPDVTVTQRSDSDQFLLVASDGLWAALENQEACDLALLCRRK
jgi:protein phosphatase 2C